MVQVAAFNGRDYVIPDDIKVLTHPTLAHRIIVGPAARIKGITADTVLDELLRSLPVPGVKVR